MKRVKPAFQYVSQVGQYEEMKPMSMTQRNCVASTLQKGYSVYLAEGRLEVTWSPA